MLNWLADQSFQSVGAGPTFVALRAGTQHEKKATPSSSSATPPNVAGLKAAKI